MKRIVSIVAVAAALTATGCGLMKATGIMKEPPPNTVVMLQVDRAKAFADSDTIVIPTLYLRLPVEGKVSAHMETSALNNVGRSGSGGGATAIARYKVDGLDKALAQEIAKAGYDDLVAKLRADGFKVLTFDDIKNQEAVSGQSRYSADAAYGLPVEDGQLVATPTDEMALKPGMGNNLLSPYMHFGKSRLTEGTILMPTFTLISPLAKTDTNSSGASVALYPGMVMSNGFVSLLTHGGGWGSAKLKKWVFGLSDGVGTIVKTADTTSHAANALGKTLSMLTGFGSNNVKSGAYTMTIDRAAYRDAAIKALKEFNDELAKVAAASKKA